MMSLGTSKSFILKFPFLFLVLKSSCNSFGCFYFKASTLVYLDKYVLGKEWWRERGALESQKPEITHILRALLHEQTHRTNKK
jgi:hypothetical protein